jgi:hypothetical protein
MSNSDTNELENLAKNSSEFIANLLVHIATSVTESFGHDAGEKAIRKGLRAFGIERGRKIREKVQSLGLETSIDSFTKHYDFPLFPAFRGTREIGENRKVAEIEFCPLANYWKKAGFSKIGLLYCEEVDDGIREGFDPALKHENPENPLKGGKNCVHIDSYD